ncbi:MAG TPA: hypothetical protein VHA77_06735 [Xanthobacteraceae bacterium]|jgi:hypothetical protein|nr:hypothetical protein [Xanthobacteraceae bacterium]
MRSCNNATRAAALIALAAVALTAAGCSDIYYDRRDTIGLGAGDSLAANQAVQMVDPWPPASASRNIGFDGYRMQTAVERYRANRVIPPTNSGTSSADYQQSQASNPSAVNSASAGAAVK